MIFYALGENLTSQIFSQGKLEKSKWEFNVFDEFEESHFNIKEITESNDKFKKEIEEYNKANNIDDSNLVNGRRQTNLGIFRAYLNSYLANCPYINKDMTFMVRQLSPTETGVPIQIYAFSSNKAWISYENIQSDIFDHVFAVVTMFDLKIYQKPSSNSLAVLPEILE